MKGIIISPGSSGQTTLDFRKFKKSGAAYAVAKGYKHWPGVVKILKLMSGRSIALIKACTQKTSNQARVQRYDQDVERKIGCH